MSENLCAAHSFALPVTQRGPASAVEEGSGFFLFASPSLCLPGFSRESERDGR